jgi:hypothetical protein
MKGMFGIYKLVLFSEVKGSVRFGGNLPAYGPDSSDRWTCWYDYKCPSPNNHLLLTKRKCNMMRPIFLGPLESFCTQTLAQA